MQLIWEVTDKTDFMDEDGNEWELAKHITLKYAQMTLFSHPQNHQQFTLKCRWVWPGDITITDCASTHGTMKKRHIARTATPQSKQPTLFYPTNQASRL